MSEQLSADGKWRWDGQAWQPVESAPGDPNVEPASVPAEGQRGARSSTRVQPPPGFWRMAAVAVIALVVGGVCGTAIGSSNASNPSSANRSSPSSSATSPSTTTASLAGTYATVATSHLTTLGNALGSIGADCGSDIAKCKADAANIGTEAKSFLAEIGKLTVPACLSATNSELSGALEYLLDGSSEAVAGIDAQDATEISKATDLMTLAGAHISKATALINAHPCG